MNGFIKKTRKRIWLLMLVVFICTTPAATDAENNDPNSVNKEVLTSLEQRMQKKISVDFRDTAIEDVLRIMAEQADVDIVKSPKVFGNVTATLTEIPLEEALNNILRAHDFGYILDKNMIRIAPSAEISDESEKLVNRIYRIIYANVDEVEKSLEKFISNRGSLSSSPGTSNIIVTDTESKIKAIDTFIEEIDRITPQIMVEVRIYDITSTESFDVIVDWDAGRNTAIDTITKTDKETITDTHTPATDTYTTTTTDTSATDTYTTTITESDDPDATAPVITETVTTQSPATTGTGTVRTETPASDGRGIVKTQETTTESTSYRSRPFVSGGFDRETGGSIRFGLMNDMVDIDIALSMLHKQVGATLLANPSILVLDNETAQFKIVREIPYKEQSATSDGGSMTSTQFKDVGVQLQVTPHITRDGMLRLHIIPEFGIVEDQQRDSTGALLVPTVSTRMLDTKALVRNNQTVVLGGLRKREITQDIRKMPLLGDLPLLGGMFTDTSESVKTNELLIFITPRIVIEPTLSPDDIEALKRTNIPKAKTSKVSFGDVSEENK